MKTLSTLSAIALAVGLAACDKPKAPTAPPAPAPKPTVVAPVAPKGPAVVDVKVYHASMEEAMAAIPPAQRADFQKVWNCELKKPEKDRPALDPDWVVKKTAELVANPAIANCQ